MKKLALFVVLITITLPVVAQSPESGFFPPKRLPEYEFKLPDSLSHMTPWLPSASHTSQLKSSLSVDSVAAVIVPKLPITPRRVFVGEGGVLWMNRLTISNGQASNWGTFPSSYLDARTISMPLR